jgi:hypothetical protein
MDGTLAVSQTNYRALMAASIRLNPPPKVDMPQRPFPTLSRHVDVSES